MNTFIEDLSPELRANHIKQNLAPIISSDGRRWLRLSQKLGEVRSNTDRPITREIAGVEDLSELSPGMIKVTYLEDYTVHVEVYDEQGKRTVNRLPQYKERVALIHPLSNQYEISDDGETLVIFPMQSGKSLLELMGYQLSDIGDDEAGQVALQEAGGFRYNIVDTFKPVEDENGSLAINPIPVSVPKQN